MKRSYVTYSSIVAALTITGLLVIAPLATAQQTNGKPFDEIWAAITDLQSQIDNIETTPGSQGPAGEDGEVGLSCWDLNEDGVKNDDSEDANGDGIVDVQDCRGAQGEPGVDGEDGQDANTAALQAEIDALGLEVADLNARLTALEAGSDSGDGGDGGDTTDQDNDADSFTVGDGDCDDANADVNPGALEIANGIDDDCDGEVDEGTTISIGDFASTEGDFGTKYVSFPVLRSGDLTGTSTVDFATADGTIESNQPPPATSPSDYAFATGILTFVAGDDSAVVTIEVAGDLLPEPNERFFVNLSNCVGCTISDAQGEGIIQNDD